MSSRRTRFTCGLLLVAGALAFAAGKEGGAYALRSIGHAPKPSRDIIEVGCQEIVPVQLPQVPGPSVFLNIQFKVTVPAGSTSLMVYVYDPTDYNANDFDVVVRYGQEVGFTEDPPGSGQGYVVYDWASFSLAAYEECPIFNEDGSPIQAGDYYFALMSYENKPGGPVGMKACVNGAFFALTEGEGRAKTVEAYGGQSAHILGEQGFIDVPPADVTDFLVTIEPAALSTEFVLVVRAGLPITVDAQGNLPADVVMIDAFGGYEEACFTVLEGGFTLFVEAFGLGETAEDAALTVRFNACFQDLAIGDAECIQKTIPGIYYDGAAATNEVPDAVQYRVTVTPAELASCASGELAVTIAQTNVAPGEESADFLLYCNKGAPIPLRQDNGLPDFTQAPDMVFQNATAGAGAETITFKGAGLVAGDYWFLVSQDTSGADSAPVLAELCARLDCGASFKRGYVNSDNTVNVADAVSLLGYLFAQGAAPVCLDATDVNDDGKPNIADAVALLGYLFASRPAPAAPFLTCGTDPTSDDVPCDATALQCAGK